MYAYSYSPTMLLNLFGKIAEKGFLEHKQNYHLKWVCLKRKVTTISKHRTNQSKVARELASEKMFSCSSNTLCTMHIKTLSKRN